LRRDSFHDLHECSLVRECRYELVVRNNNTIVLVSFHDQIGYASVGERRGEERILSEVTMVEKWDVTFEGEKIVWADGSWNLKKGTVSLA
jgi:hypothetical protein